MNRTMTSLAALGGVAVFLGAGAPMRIAPNGALIDRCALLTDAEVTEALGPHGKGNNGIENEWGNSSCRWTATNPAPGHPEVHDAVEVAVFEGNQLAWARDQMSGDPVDGVVPGARYDRSYGTVWFECAGGRVCAVRMHTAASKGRKENAVKLARLVNGRAR